ncbi:MAG: bifunctional precorrin-2 dehydrogenase/sirohydrochlorin ferrochelatase, partial [Chloroflexota bacterium]|nr:bifunctional precorrin-2 dehydrogenase/sirohydrochlorin ferrochelatase [Chloroflexota bacterium]
MAVRMAPGRAETSARYYPVSLKLEGRAVLVVGGGVVAERKVQALRQAGARVQVVAGKPTARLKRLATEGSIELVERPYQAGDVGGAFVVVAATSDEAVNREVFAEADLRGIPCNVVDVPELCSFIVPSVFRRGDLTIAVSTNGRSPSFSKMVRQHIEAEIGPEYAEYLELVGSLRDQVKAYKSPGERERVWECIHHADVLGALRAGDKSRAREIV